MKLIFVFFVVLVFSLLLIISLDIAIGYSLSESIFHLINPFKVIDTGEYVMIIGFILIVIGNQIYLSKKNRSNNSNKAN